MHTFFTCSFAQKVWNLIPLCSVVHIADDQSFERAIVIFRGSICLLPSGISTNILPWVYWQIWTSRNFIVFEDRTLFAEKIALRSITSAREWIYAQPIKDTHQTTLLEPRIKRFQGSTNMSSPRVFTDAAWHKESSHAGLEWIFFNETGEFDHWSEFQLHVNAKG